MLKNPKLGDLVETRNQNKIGRIIEINTYWGWLFVKFTDGHRKEYTLNKGKCQGLRKLNSEEIADYFLKLESMGLTDSWSEQ